MNANGALRFVVIALLVSAAAVAGAPPAHASCGEQTTQISRGNNYSAYGTAGNIYLYNHDLGSEGCDGPTAQTQLMVLSSDARNWVEVGARRYLTCGLFGCDVHYKVFGEYGFAGSWQVDLFSDVMSGMAPRFKVANVLGTFTWKIYWDPSGGTNYSLLTTYQSMWSQQGSAQGEVSKVGSTADAANQEWDLKFQDAHGNNKPWASQVCYSSSISGWHWRRVADTEFFIEPGGGACSV